MIWPIRSRYRIALLIAIGMILLLALVLIQYRTPQATPTVDLTPQERLWLQQHKDTLEVLFGYEAPPNAFHNDQGTYVGLLMDYLQEIESKLGFSIPVRSFETWDDLIQYAQSGADNFIIVGIAETEERRSHLSFTNSFIRVPYVLVTRVNHSTVNSLEDIVNDSVCTVRNYAINDYLRLYAPEIVPIEVADNLAGLRAVATGQCDTMVVNQAYASYLIQEQGLSNLIIAAESGYLNRLAVASPINNPILYNIMEKVISAIPENRRDELYLQWILPHKHAWIDLTTQQIVVTGMTIITLLMISLSWAITLRMQINRKTRVISEQFTQLSDAQQDLKRALDNEREQRILNEALLGIASGITSTLDTDSVMKRILEHVGDVVPHDAAGIMRLEGNLATLQFWQGYLDAHVNTINATGFDIRTENVYSQMVATREPLLIKNTHDYAGWKLYPDITWIKSFLGVPILAHNTIIGFLNLDSSTENFFTESHAKRASALVRQIAIAVENAQLYDQLEAHARELERHVANRTEALSQANIDLQRLSNAKDEFVSNVSHELKTPITTLKLQHFMLRKRPENIDRHLTILERETARLSRTIDDLLRLSRLDQARTEVALNPVDLNTIAESLVHDRALPAEQKDLALTFSGQSNLPMVLADQGLVEQVMSILLTNAVNYTPPGGHIILSTQTCEQDGKQWAGFLIKDTGIGIPQEEHGQLFDRFFQGIASQQSGVPGTGLGLAIAKEIIDRHSGRIEIESTGVLGEGTTFSVWLPIAS